MMNCLTQFIRQKHEGHADTVTLQSQISFSGSSHRNRDRVIGEMVFFQIPWQLTKYAFFARTIVTTLDKEVRISYLFFCFYTSLCFTKDYLMSAVRSSSSSANERWQNAIITLRLTNERSPTICSACANRWSQSSQVSGDVLATSLPYVKTFSRVTAEQHPSGQLTRFRASSSSIISNQLRYFWVWSHHPWP